MRKMVLYKYSSTLEKSSLIVYNRTFSSEKRVDDVETLPIEIDFYWITSSFFPNSIFIPLQHFIFEATCDSRANNISIIQSLFYY